MSSSGVAPASTENDVLTYAPLVAELRGNFESGKTKDLAWRRKQLEQLVKMHKECHEEMTEAVRADLGGPKLRGFFEVGGGIEAAEMLEKLDEWAAPKQVGTPMFLSPTKIGKSWIRQEAKGVVLVIAPWNFPMLLAFQPVVAALAAGNCVVLKPSEVSPNCAALMERLVEKYMDTSCIRVVQGAVPETTALLKEQWDHIFYTGNGAVGRIVLKAAAVHLTPCSLELGGKSPVIIDKSANMKSAVERIAFTKFMTNVGQICVAPDYILIHREREEEFVTEMAKWVKSSYGENVKNHPDYGRIINSNHARRLLGLVSQTKGQVVFGGQDSADPEARFVPPTLIRRPEMGEPLMTEEIFGPVLAVVPVDNADDAIRKVNEVCNRPLALYIFSEDQKVTDKILDNTLSGGCCVNDTVFHLFNPELPFGGVGGSGYGCYHGKAGFDEFTHRRPVFKQDTTILTGSGIPPPPYTDEIYNLAIKAQLVGFLTENQKTAAKVGLAIGGAVAAGLAIRNLRRSYPEASNICLRYLSGRMDMLTTGLLSRVGR